MNKNKESDNVEREIEKKWIEIWYILLFLLSNVWAVKQQNSVVCYCNLKEWVGSFISVVYRASWLCSNH